MFVEIRLCMAIDSFDDRHQCLAASSTERRCRLSVRPSVLGLVLVITALSGCGVVSRGLLYTDTTQPLCRDLRGTDLGSKVGSGSSKRVEIPTTQIDLTAEWDSRAIGDIARTHGITTVHGCDSRRQSYVLGLWRRDEVIIYGEGPHESGR
jgi:hypothetical protein